MAMAGKPEIATRLTNPDGIPSLGRKVDGGEPIEIWHQVQHKETGVAK